MATDDKRESMKRAEVRFESLRFEFFHTNGEDHIFRTLVDSGEFYEQSYLKAIREFIEPGDVVYDIGANIGTHSVFFAGVCGAKVLAFEPVAAALDCLRTNIAANDLDDKVEVFPVGLGAETARMRTQGHGRNNQGAVELVNDEEGGISVVPLATLPDLPDPKFVKIDVESMELSALRGARAMIERVKPVIGLECANRDAFLQFAGFLEAFGYMPIACYNATPTHIFQVFDHTELERKLALQVAATFIDATEKTNRLRRRFDSAQSTEHRNNADAFAALQKETRILRRELARTREDVAELQEALKSR